MRITPFGCDFRRGKSELKYNQNAAIRMMTKVVYALLFGGVDDTFLKAKGKRSGKLLVEEYKLDLARQLLQEAKTHKLNLGLPIGTTSSRIASMQMLLTRMLG